MIKDAKEIGVGRMSKYVFISYASENMDMAEKVCEFLEENGILCWIAPRNIKPGDNYAPQIVASIRSCNAFVLLASDHTNKSGHVSNEVNIAFESKKTIIPFRLEDVEFTDEYVYFLGRKHRIEAYMDLKLGLRSLLKTLVPILKKDDTGEVKKEKSKDKILEKEVKKEQGVSREKIAKILVDKIKKYPYNLADKLDTMDKYEAFKRLAMTMLRETMSLYRQNKKLSLDNDFVEEIIATLTSGTGRGIQVQGLPGCAKNMLLQLAYFKMLDNFKHGTSDYLPIYIASSYYEKLPYSPENIYAQMKNVLSKEFEEFFAFVNSNKEVKPVLLMEAIREHNVAKISPENVVFDLWKPYGRYNRITTMDVGLIKNKERIKRVLPLLKDSKDYLFTMHSIPVDDERSVLTFIDCIIKMYEYDLDAKDIYKVLKKFQFPMIDIFIVRLVAKEVLSSYDIDEIRITDMYETLALGELYGDEEQLYEVSKELFRYVFDEKYKFNNEVYNGALWSLPHKHNTYLEFLIAYYFLNEIKNYQSHTDYAFFRTMLTAMANNFLTSFIQDDYTLQETFLDFISDNYEVFDIQQKSNAAYWLGKITYKNLSKIAINMLTREFTKLKPLVKTNNKQTQENCDNHFLFRSVCTALLSHGQANMMDEYLCIVITNDIANAINRGTTIEYYGDNYQIAAHDAYYFDTVPGIGEQVIKILNSRIEARLTTDTGKFVEHNLVTMLTLLQMRMQIKKENMKFDIIPYARKALHFLNIYETRPQNVVSGKLVFYFKSMKEDIQEYLEDDTFDIAPKIFNKYRDLKQIKRSQWVMHSIEDPESIAEHTYGAWLMAMFFLPEETDDEGYNKKEILDMLLVHDMAEAEAGDIVMSLSEPKKDLKSQNDILRKLFLKGTYPDMANMTYYYNVWTGYYNGININARTARDINLIHSVYTFCEYYSMYPECFTDEEVKTWIREENNLNTEIGYRLFERLIKNNKEYSEIISLAKV